MAEQAREEEFDSIIDDAGFKLDETQLGVSLVPELTLSFSRIRELSEGDEAAVRKRIQEFREKYSGWNARRKGWFLDWNAWRKGLILDSLIEASSVSGNFNVSSATVSILPFPSASVRLKKRPVDPKPTEGGE
jgi:hypothetical protein